MSKRKSIAPVLAAALLSHMPESSPRRDAPKNFVPEDDATVIARVKKAYPQSKPK
jgi:hypothetical protein